MIDQKWYKRFKAKNVLLRLDLNVPISDSQILDDSRVLSSIETVKRLYEAGAKVIVVSHLGKPDGKNNPELSLKPVVESFSQNANLPCFLHLGNIDRKSIKKQLKHSVVFLENVRFEPGEKNCEEGFVKKLAGIADFFINDAFSVSHRSHASVSGVAQHLPSFAGPSILHETQNLNTLIENPKKPFWVVMGGAKLKTKMPLIDSLKDKVQGFLLGGGIANTFYKALGHEIGSSLHDPDNLNWARSFFEWCQLEGSPKLILPQKVIVKNKNIFKEKDFTEVLPEDNILDASPSSISDSFKDLDSVKTFFWNGAFGAFEMKGASQGTESLAVILGNHSAKVYIGGGETLASVKMAKMEGSFYFESLAGGATLYYLSGKELPGLEVLNL
ncbi:phosphoglycerate kinase [bacterium]|nr:phosphoglycerate kinase [bacterium]